MNEDIFWLTLWGSLAALLTVLILGATYICTEHAQSMAEKGYCEQQKLGSVGSIWIKCSLLEK